MGTRRSTSYSLCITESREQSVRSHKSLLDDNDSGGSHWDLQSFTPPPSDENKSDSSSKSVELACKGCRPNARMHSFRHDPECPRSHSCGSEDLSARLSNLEKGYGERKNSVRSRRSQLRSRTASMRPIPEEKHNEADAEPKTNCLCSSNRTLLWVGIGVTLLILIVVVIVLVKRRTSGAASELEPDST